MEALSLIDQKRYFRIEEIEVQNFIGLKKISDENNKFILKIGDKDKFNILYGENGMGKTTLLELLNPYSEMISRDIKKSIEFPAYKKVSLVSNKGEKVRVEISFNENSTKGYIYINDEITIETRKGNITEFNFLIDKIFGDFDKFKNSSFLRQGINELISATPNERIKILNKFMPDISLYDDIKKTSESEEAVFKNDLKHIELSINDLKLTEASQKNIENFPIEEIESKIKKLNELKLQIEESIEKKEKELSVEDKEFINFISFSKDLLKDEDFSKILLRVKELEEEISKIDNISEKDIESKENQVKELVKELEDLNYFLTNLNNIKDKDFLVSKKNQEVLKIELAKLKDIEEKLSYKNKVKKELIILEEKLKTFKVINKVELQASKVEIENNIKKFRKEVLEKREEWQKKKSEFDTVSLNISKINEKNKEDLKSMSIKELIVKNQFFSKEKEKQVLRMSQLKDEIEKYEKLIKSSDTEKIKCHCCNSILEIKLVEKSILERKEELEKILVSNIDFNRDLVYLELLQEKIEKYSDFEDKKIELEKIKKDGVLTKEKLDLIEKDKEIIEEKEKEIIKIENEKEQIKKLEETISYLPKEDNLEEIKLLIDSKSKDLLYISHLYQRDFFKEGIVSDLIAENIKQIDFKNQLKEEINKFLFESKALLKKSKDLNENLSYSRKQIVNHEKAEIELKGKSKEIIEKTIFEKKAERGRLKEDYKKANEELNESSVKKAEYLKDKKTMDLTLEKYEKLLEEKEIAENKKEVTNTIKNYSNRIKKNYIANFFSDIILNANELIDSEEGTLGDIKVKIVQKNSRSFNIVALRNEIETEDISLLSGAEQSVVARSIYWSLAKNNHFGLLWLDESDGMLSKKNKQSFINTIDKAIDSFGVNQVFIISHNEDYLKLSDRNIILK